MVSLRARAEVARAVKILIPVSETHACSDTLRERAVELAEFRRAWLVSYTPLGRSQLSLVAAACKTRSKDLQDSSTRPGGRRRYTQRTKITYKSDLPIFRVAAFSIEVSDDLDDGDRERPDERYQHEPDEQGGQSAAQSSLLDATYI